jgi:long-chain acyl-CoA synthetase
MIDITGLVNRLTVNPKGKVVTFERNLTVERSHAQVYEDVQAAHSRLLVWGVKAGMRIGLRAPNCYEWLVYDLALIQLRAVSVAFTDDFSAISAEELCARYSLSLLLVSGKERAGSGAASYVAALDGTNAEVSVKPQDECSDDEEFEHPWLIFSSGSSGGSKGLVLNRSGVEASVDAFTTAVGPLLDDCLLLFLPISNFQQRLMYYAAIWYGFDIIITEPARLFHALKEMRPTMLVAPPGFYEAFESQFSNLPNWKQMGVRLIARTAYALCPSAVADRVARRIFQDAYQTLGGRVRFMVTGMAPTKRSTLELFKLMRLPLFETYGLTECGSVSLNLPRAHRIGSVGRLLCGVTVEIGCDGEIFVCRERMPAFAYFQCADGENETTFVSEHRVATGDIGHFDRDGFLYLLGRKKEIIITSGGEKVHPEAVEAQIDACSSVSKSVVYDGGGFLSAVVLPKDPRDPNAKRHIERHIEEMNGRGTSVKVEKVVFTDRAFCRENGFLRPNLKLDRKNIARQQRGY